ncbi:hypothetical protein ABT097_33170 [Streptomyces sp. NPDC002225]|uniref:hypothetical protein n=1 Tax=Streptomyces sp. NPDC002225 TaxID=3154413 RepID=UPI00332BCC24
MPSDGDGGAAERAAGADGVEVVGLVLDGRSAMQEGGGAVEFFAAGAAHSASATKGKAAAQTSQRSRVSGAGLGLGLGSIWFFSRYETRAAVAVKWQVEALR